MTEKEAYIAFIFMGNDNAQVAKRLTNRFVAVVYSLIKI